ncbi:MAG TPA: PHP-associated domain-containing protein, partial [Chthoniobacterales bacterium]
DCFDAIELCHFWGRFFNPNRRAVEVAERFGKPLIATSDAHRLHAFGSNYTSIPRPTELTIEGVIAALRAGPLRVTNPACSFTDLMSTIYFVFVSHPLRRRKRLESAAQT